jgi:hypothetical protein
MTRTMVVRCATCDTHQVGVVQGDYIAENYLGYGDDVRFTLAKCPSCDAPFLTSQDGRQVENDYDPAVSRFEWGSALFLYPADGSQLGAAVPKTIRASFTC